MPISIQKCAFLLGIATPKHKYHAFPLLVEHLNCPVSKPLPASLLMGASAGLFNR